MESDERGTAKETNSSQSLHNRLGKIPIFDGQVVELIGELRLDTNSFVNSVGMRGRLSYSFKPLRVKI